MAYKVPGTVPFDLHITSLTFSLHLGHGSLLLFYKYSKHILTSGSSYKLFPLPGNPISQKTTWLALLLHMFAQMSPSQWGLPLKTFIYNCISLCIAFSCLVFLYFIIYLFILLWSILPPLKSKLHQRQFISIVFTQYPQYQERVWTVVGTQQNLLNECMDSLWHRCTILD